MSKFAGLALATDTAQRMSIIHPGTRQPLRSPGGEEAWIDLHSIDSKPWRTTVRAQQDRRMRTRGRPSAEEIDSDTTELFAAVTVGWRLFTLDGEPIDVPCSATNARELYAMPELSWLREQVDAFVADRGNFKRANSTHSSTSPAITGA